MLQQALDCCEDVVGVVTHLCSRLKSLVTAGHHSSFSSLTIRDATVSNLIQVKNKERENTCHNLITEVINLHGW